MIRYRRFTNGCIAGVCASNDSKYMSRVRMYLLCMRYLLNLVYVNMYKICGYVFLCGKDNTNKRVAYNRLRRLHILNMLVLVCSLCRAFFRRNFGVCGYAYFDIWLTVMYI